MTQRLLVVSDLHLTPPDAFDAFRAGDALATFVQASARPGTTLALAGDVFDLLQLPGRPASLDLRAAPDLIRAALGGIAATSWGRDLFQGLRQLLQSGGRCLVLPGNHDPELHHPDTRALLLGALELPDSAPLEVHRDASPWRDRIGRWEVILGHGHRADAWNDVDPGALDGALATDDASLPLPPGSRLVVQVLQPFKRDPRTGAARFSFVDLLKPEPAVALLLLYLDPGPARELLATALGLHAEQIVRAFRQRLGPQPTLAPGASIAAPPTIPEILADALAAEVEPDLRQAPNAAVRLLQNCLDGHAPAAAGTLAPHAGARRWLARAYLRHLAKDTGSFDAAATNEIDRGVMAEHLPEGSGPRVVICGHTHAAREHRLPGERVYLNTGTWIDLMQMPRLEDETASRDWIDALEADRVERFHHLTYAEVTEEGAWLRICQ